MIVTERGIVASKRVLPVGGDLTLRSILEYAAAVRSRYLRGSVREKGAILDEFCKATGRHRKSAIRLLHRGRSVAGKRRGRPRQYGGEFALALKAAWEATDCICSKRLAPFLKELVPILERHGELRVSEAVRGQLMQVSASTIDRILRPYRLKPRRGLSTTRSVSHLRRLIPVRTFAEKKGLQVGCLEVDLVAHCGTSTEGFYLYTLMAVDLVTGWIECLPVWGKSQSRVGSAIDHVRHLLPFRLLGIHSDNGSEFINEALWRYCKQHSVTFTRARTYIKNDQAHVEQKNGCVVRRLVGYDRFDSKAAFEALGQLYLLVRLQANFFQPTSKLLHSHREGAKVHKQYDRAQTPYQRLLAAGALTPAQHEGLAAYYDYLNPVQLRAQIHQAQLALWKLACPDCRSSTEAATIAALDATVSQQETTTLKEG